MKKRTEAIVGAVILAGLVVIFAGTLWLKDVGFGREEITLRARFREVGQILVGNTVKLRGVPIGRVEDIAFEPGGAGVIVSMRIDRNAPLPEDPVVLLSPESMFGDWQAEIFPRSRFPRYAYAESPDPGVLPGYALPDISRLTAVADEIASNLATLTDRVETAFTEETAASIRMAIENIQEVSERLTALVGTQQQAIEEVARNLSETSAALGEAAIAVQHTMAQVDSAVAHGEVADIVDNIARATARFDSLTVELLRTSGEFRAVAMRADSTMGAMGAVARRLEAGEGSLGMLLQDTVLYTQLVRTNALLQALLMDFQANPGKYIKLELF
ncbi:MAG TPA: MlaD family protein [Longimicrobiales bacterium]